MIFDRIDPKSVALLQAISEWGEMCSAQGAGEENGTIVLGADSQAIRDDEKLIPEMELQWKKIRLLLEIYRIDAQQTFLGEEVSRSVITTLDQSVANEHPL